MLFSLRAHLLYKKDKDYIIRDGKKGPEVVLLDKSTGRLLELTKLQGGLHQAIEAKELVALSQETRAMASITYQSLFKKFKKISGMTGTGKVAEKEFLDTYGMKVIQIPTNRKKQRIDYPDKIYETLPEKVFASLEYVKHYHEKGNPILIFVSSVEMSELYSSLLLREGIAHNLLNANNAPREAEMISRVWTNGCRDSCDLNGWTWNRYQARYRVWLNWVDWSLSVPNVWKVSVLTCKFVAVLDVRVILVCLNSSSHLKMM